MAVVVYAEVEEWEFEDLDECRTRMWESFPDQSHATPRDVMSAKAMRIPLKLWDRVSGSWSFVFALLQREAVFWVSFCRCKNISGTTLLVLLSSPIRSAATLKPMRTLADTDECWLPVESLSLLPQSTNRQTLYTHISSSLSPSPSLSQ